MKHSTTLPEKHSNADYTALRVARHAARSPQRERVESTRIIPLTGIGFCVAKLKRWYSLLLLGTTALAGTVGLQQDAFGAARVNNTGKYKEEKSKKTKDTPRPASVQPEYQGYLPDYASRDVRVQKLLDSDGKGMSNSAQISIFWDVFNRGKNRRIGSDDKLTAEYRKRFEMVLKPDSSPKEFIAKIKIGSSGKIVKKSFPSIKELDAAVSNFVKNGIIFIGDKEQDSLDDLISGIFKKINESAPVKDDVIKLVAIVSSTDKLPIIKGFADRSGAPKLKWKGEHFVPASKAGKFRLVKDFEFERPMGFFEFLYSKHSGLSAAEADAATNKIIDGMTASSKKKGVFTGGYDNAAKTAVLLLKNSSDPHDKSLCNWNIVTLLSWIATTDRHKEDLLCSHAAKFIARYNNPRMRDFTNKVGVRKDSAGDYVVLVGENESVKVASADIRAYIREYPADGRKFWGGSYDTQVAILLASRYSLRSTFSVMDVGWNETLVNKDEGENVFAKDVRAHFSAFDRTKHATIVGSSKPKLDHAWAVYDVDKKAGVVKIIDPNHAQTIITWSIDYVVNNMDGLVYATFDEAACARLAAATKKSGTSGTVASTTPSKPATAAQSSATTGVKKPTAKP